MKYLLIFQVASNLPIEFKQMRTYLVQSSSVLIDEPKMDIPEWIELLTKEFKSKGILHDYTSTNIPSSKKKLGVNGAEVKDKPSNEDELTKQWRSSPKDYKTETRLKIKLKKIAEQKAKDAANKDLEIWKDTEIMEACNEEGKKVCWECGGLLCLAKQSLGLKINKKRSYIGSCIGKIATFGDISGYANEYKPKFKKKAPKSDTASAIINTP